MALAIPAKAEMIWEVHLCIRGMEIEIWLISWKAEQSCQDTNNTFTRSSTYQYTPGEGECCKHEKIMKNGPVFSNQIVQLISNYQPIKSEHHMNKTNHTSVNKQQSEPILYRDPTPTLKLNILHHLHARWLGLLRVQVLQMLQGRGSTINFLSRLAFTQYLQSQIPIKQICYSIVNSKLHRLINTLLKISDVFASEVQFMVNTFGCWCPAWQKQQNRYITTWLHFITQIIKWFKQDTRLLNTSCNE